MGSAVHALRTCLLRTPARSRHSGKRHRSLIQCNTHKNSRFISDSYSDSAIARERNHSLNTSPKDVHQSRFGKDEDDTQK